MPTIYDETLWAGTEASLAAAIQAEEARLQQAASGYVSGSQDEEEYPRLLEVENGVGFINITGSLNNDSGFWNEFVGATGYPEIRDALVVAAKDREIKHIVLNIDSGGGAVRGLDDTAQLIRLIHTSVKPVTAFTGGAMLSAAYWLGAAAGSLFISKVAEVGSIGVIATHFERSEMLKTAGVGATVVRAGKYKALANSVEKLSDAGKAQIQEAVDSAYDLFLEHVSSMRGKSVEYVDKVMAQGRVFFGQAGVDAGLADGLKTTSELLTGIMNNSVDTRINSTYTGTKQASGLQETIGDGSMKHTLTEQDVAALAAGAADSPEPEASAGAEPVAGAEQDAAQVNVDSQADATQDEGAKEVAISAETHRFMMDQLKAAQSDLLACKLELARAQDKHAELDAVVRPLQEIAAKAVNNMRAACRAASMDFSAMNASQVLAEHQAILATFQKQFPVGGVASAADTSSVKKGAAPVDARTKAVYAAVPFNK